jgi:hypothetical protein
VRIGATFLNKEGSASVLLDALPVNSKLQLCTPKAKDASAAQTA